MQKKRMAIVTVVKLLITTTKLHKNKAALYISVKEVWNQEYRLLHSRNTGDEPELILFQQ